MQACSVITILSTEVSILLYIKSYSALTWLLALSSSFHANQSLSHQRQHLPFVLFPAASCVLVDDAWSSFLCETCSAGEKLSVS